MMNTLSKQVSMLVTQSKDHSVTLCAGLEQLELADPIDADEPFSACSRSSHSGWDAYSSLKQAQQHLPPSRHKSRFP